MKCPKCGYLGFEHVERCRNCGYDFSLTASVRIPDIPIRNETPEFTALDELSLIDAAAATPSGAAMSQMRDLGVDLDRVLGAQDYPPEVRRAAAPREELRLFGPPIPDDEPLITKASPPRTPLSVRRATPEVLRVRAGQPRLQSLDLALDLDASSSMDAVITPGSRVGRESWPDPHPQSAESATVGARLVAVIIDLLILAVIDAVVVYFTMQICGITVDDLGILPKGPLLAFLFVQNGGYLVAFTAGGQTLGKMAAGIRVVAMGSGSDSTLDLGRAFLRTAMWLLLAAPAGLGFLTALFSRDHRGLHDRFAGTRVVR
jgi:uncharacterized RDD family membrane protein YckC